MSDIFGFFSDPRQTVPQRDPGFSIPCPCCTEKLGTEQLVTISLMKPGDDKSYFFRAHKHCWDAASEDEQAFIEGLLIDDRLSP